MSKVNVYFNDKRMNNRWTSVGNVWKISKNHRTNTAFLINCEGICVQNIQIQGLNGDRASCLVVVFLSDTPRVYAKHCCGSRV